MSSNPWDLPLASADSSLLTTDECYLLLDADFSDGKIYCKVISTI